MRFLRKTFAFLSLFILLAACSPTDKTYLREGIGSSLYGDDGGEAARQQNIYIDYICSESGLASGQTCDPDTFGPTAWTQFVQAGMNDIDVRCDAYLVWLDSRRRAREPVLQEISDIRTATTAILAATGVGVEPIAIAAAAFGLASSSFTNLNASLVFALDQSTVQTIVVSRQTDFRRNLPTVIDNRPAAIYALRSYLRLCMPMTIDTQVNTTVRLFEGGRAGIAALAAEQANPLIDAKAVRTAILRNSSSAVVPFRPQLRPPPPPPAGYGRIGTDEGVLAKPVGSYETSLDPSDVVQFQSVVCLPKTGKFTVQTRDAILAFLRKNQKDSSFPDRITAVDGTRLRDALDAGPKC